MRSDISRWMVVSDNLSQERIFDLILTTHFIPHIAPENRQDPLLVDMAEMRDEMIA